MIFVFNIDPKPAPRMVRSDKWAKRKVVEDCYSWRNALRLMANAQGYNLTPDLTIHFIVPMAESWSEKKKRLFDGKPHQQRPDIDNLAKNIMDTFSVEDGFVYKLNAIKVWGRKGQIIITEKNDEKNP